MRAQREGADTAGSPPARATFGDVDRDRLRDEPSGETVVVVTAMRLSPRARTDLSEMLGPGYLVVDIKRAPSTANIVLAPAVSGFALAQLRQEFPQARVLFAEVDDAVRRIRYAGPLSRALASGPDGYFVARGLDSLVPVVENQARLQLAGDTRPSPLQIGDDDRPGTVGLDWDDHRLDLAPVDALVTRLLGTQQPRRTQLWLAVVAECALHLARQSGAAVSVDVSDLDPAAVAELRLRVAGEAVSLLP